LTLIAAAWFHVVERGVEEEAVELAKRAVAEHLVPKVITGVIVERYVRKALRHSAWSKLPLVTRALLLASRKLSIVKSPALREILRRVFVEIELYTLRGRAAFYGALLALRQGLVEALRDLKRLITLGIGYLNLPLMWRVLG
jgi:hypothetical protein